MSSLDPRLFEGVDFKNGDQVVVPVSDGVQIRVSFLREGVAAGVGEYGEFLVCIQTVVVDGVILNAGDLPWRTIRAVAPLAGEIEQILRSQYYAQLNYQLELFDLPRVAFQYGLAMAIKQYLCSNSMY